MFPWRGEFRMANGLVVPNNLTDWGAGEMLKMALCGDDGTLVAAAGSFYIGLCSAVPAVDLTLDELDEPTIGTGGYARKAVTRDTDGWPNSGTVNGQAYVETANLVWEATGDGFDQEVQRLFFCAESTAITGNLIALSAAFPNPLTITTATDAEDRTFRYRVYGR